MTAFFAEYGLFLLETLTILLVFLAVVVLVMILVSRKEQGDQPQGRIEVIDLRHGFEDAEAAIRAAISPRKAYKAWEKEQETRHKQRGKEAGTWPEKVMYVLDFDGDIHASAVHSLREEITAILAVAQPGDEVVLRLESAGGVVHGYGLAASQLQRIRDRGVPLTVCVDKVAASGGYMMACIADKLVAAPFAILGSIGVIGQLPNFNRVLKKYDIDFEMHTAGAYKRTLTVFGENTPEARNKFIEDLNETHRLFRDFVARFRPALDLPKVATGEIWFGTDAIGLKLVDELGTSDEYLASRIRECHVVQVVYRYRKTFAQRLGFGVEASLDRLLVRWLGRLQRSHFPG